MALAMSFAFAHGTARAVRPAGLEASGVDDGCVCGVCGRVKEIDHVGADPRQEVQRKICGIGRTDKKIIDGNQEKQSQSREDVRQAARLVVE